VRNSETISGSIVTRSFAPDPSDVLLLGAVTVVAFANLFPDLVQKPWFMDMLHKHADSFDDSAGGVL
jgi:hypothetical protein